MSKKYKEKLTVNGENIIFHRERKPIENVSVESDDKNLKLQVYDITDSSLLPSNYDKPEGVPMTLMSWHGVKIDLSKRTVEEMSYWHRSADFDEVIFCFQGGIRWETDLGEVKLRAGQMLRIPRGIAHRSMPGKSDELNIILEIKIWPTLKEVIPDV